MRIAIIDENREDRRLIAQHIRDFYCDYQESLIVKEFESGEHFFQKFQSGFFQIAFTGSSAGESDCVQVAQMIRAADCVCRLIFVHSSTAYAVSSYEAEATYYLLKPIVREQVFRALSRCYPEQVRANRYLEITCNRQNVHLLLRHMLFLDVQGNAVRFHTVNGILTSYLTFGATMKLLKDDGRFLECYKACAVNMDHVTQVLDLDFLMSDGSTVPIRKKSFTAIRNHYQNYIFERALQGDRLYHS